MTQGIHRLAKTHRNLTFRAASGRGQTRPSRVDFRRLVEGAPDIIFRYSIDPPRVDYVNAAVEVVLGVPARAFMADASLIERLVHPADLPQRRLGTPDLTRVKPRTLRIRRADGARVALEIHPRPIFDADGRLIAIEGIARDVTPRFEAEEALDSVLSNAPVVLWTVDEDRRMTSVRGAGLPGIGSSPGTATGPRLQGLEADPVVCSHVDRAFLGETLVVDLPIGGRALSTVMSPRRDDEGKVTGVVGVSTDVTAVRELEAAAVRDSRERIAIQASLQRLDPKLGLDVLADRTSHELLRLRGVEWTNVLGFGPRGLAYVLGSAGAAPAVVTAGRRLPSNHARRLRARAAEGAWVAPFEARDEDGSFGLAMAAAGVTAVGFQPLRSGGTTVGLLVIATREVDGVALLEQHASALAEYGALASVLFGAALSDRARTEHIQAELSNVIARGRFSPVFQPIVDLRDRQPVAWEALTRFEDGTPPERRFAEAAAVGLSRKLELAAIDAALQASGMIADGMPLTVNVSSGLVLDGDPLRDLLAGVGRPVTLELSEHERIDDYDALREALAAIGPVTWSVDDAGSGYASLRHCLELRPHDIKLDRSLITGADRDPARLAVIAGLRQVADAIGSRLIAEGIETDEEAAAIWRVGVRFGQGYLFGRPMPAHPGMKWT